MRVAEANVKGTEAKLIEVRAGKRRVEADLARWQSEFHRIEELVAARAQTGSLLDETRSKLRSAEAAGEEIAAQITSADVALIQSAAALDSARADVVAAAAAIDVANADAGTVLARLAYTKIESPFDGIVTHRNVDTGHLTQPGAEQATAFHRIPIRHHDDPGQCARGVRGGGQSRRPRPGKASGVKGQDRRREGHADFVGIDPKTRTERVEIDIPNPGGRLQPGLYAYATVIAEEKTLALTLPLTAVVTEQGKDYCVVILAGKAVRRPIQVGLSDGVRVEVVSGVGEGEAVVKANASSLEDGQPVVALEPTSPSPSRAKP